ncbi:FAD-dependent thymidylate synthase [Phenylobacterium sp.]|uniref:FAD-dependent thymidylate synthase n=1 Tax=Phenylobacterium sp. TaxID=1871053 RepID=UPI002FCA7B6A
MRVFVNDDLPPEASAMLQALYSRSDASALDHLERVRERGADKFMASYYVGYGHASIGDCGYTTLFVEDVSLLACKAVQDNPLFSGQETSTRYIDFSRRPVVDPLGTAASQAILNRWIAFYAAAEPQLRAALSDTLVRPVGVGASTWSKAIAARAFDIVRGFLPAGVTSQTAWSTNLRQAQEHSLRLASHPLAEVQTVGTHCIEVLRERYPNSFGHVVSEEELAYLKRAGTAEAYIAPDPSRGLAFDCDAQVDAARLHREAGDLLRSRPRKASLPKSLGRYGRYVCRFTLDFGSFRDLQRHRGGLCAMPLLTDQLGIHPWYIEQLPPALQDEALELLRLQAAAIDALRAEGVPEVDLQYFQPLGMRVQVELNYDLPQMVYVAELRSGKTVHATLREIAWAMGRTLRAQHPDMALYLDESPDEMNWRRGDQDIVDRFSDARSAA